MAMRFLIEARQNTVRHVDCEHRARVTRNVATRCEVVRLLLTRCGEVNSTCTSRTSCRLFARAYDHSDRNFICGFFNVESAIDVHVREIKLSLLSLQLPADQCVTLCG
jgi:hypothetical protein